MSSPPPLASSGESDGGAFGWWMPGSNTGSKVGVFIAIVAVVAIAAIATHWVVKRWKQHHGAEQGSLDDQEILGPNAIKELFFSRPANANTDAEDTSHAFSDGSVWLKEEARRRYQSTGLLQPTPAGPSVQDAPVPAPTQRLGYSAQGAQLELTQAAVPSGASPGPLQAEDSMSIASSTAYLLDERRLGRDMAGQDGPEISPALTPMHFPTIYNGPSGPLYTTPSSKGPPQPGSEGCSPQDMPGSGPGAGGLLGTHSYASSAAGEPSAAIQRPEHLAMMGTMAIMCPGEPALEQRLARVLQEALHGPGSNGGASPPLPTTSNLLAPYPAMAPYPSVALLPTMAEGTEGTPSPAAGARTPSTSAFTHASTNRAVAASLEGSRHVIDMQPSGGAGMAGFGGVGLFAWPGGSGPQMWGAGGVPAGMRPGTGTVTARDILTGARSPRDLAALIAAVQQQPAVMRGGSPRSQVTAAAYGQNIGPASSQSIGPASSQNIGPASSQNIGPASSQNIGPASSPAPVMPLGASPSQPQSSVAASPAPSPFQTPAPQQPTPLSTSPRSVPLARLSLVPHNETGPVVIEPSTAAATPVTGPHAPQQQQRNESGGQPTGNDAAQAASEPTTPINTEPSTPVKAGINPRDTGLCSLPGEKPVRASMASAAAPAGEDEVAGHTDVARAGSSISAAAVDQLTVNAQRKQQQVMEEEHGEMQQPATPVRSSTPAAIGGLEAAEEAEPPVGSQPATPSAVPSSTSARRARLDQSPFEMPSGTPLDQSPFSNPQSTDPVVRSRPPRPPSESGWRASLPEGVPVAGPSQGPIRQRSQTTSSAGQSMSSVSSRDYTQYDRHRLSGPGDASGRPVHMSMNEFAAERGSGRLTGMSSLKTPGMSRAGSMAEQPAVSVDRELLSNPLFGARLTPGAPSNSSRLSVAGVHMADVRGVSAVVGAASDEDDDDELL